jgi:hypothetical protein
MFLSLGQYESFQLEQPRPTCSASIGISNLRVDTPIHGPQQYLDGQRTVYFPNQTLLSESGRSTVGALDFK